MSRSLGPADLHSYQNDSVSHILAHQRCALFMPLGGGKTISVLTALEHLSTVEDIYPVLVLAPLRVARKVWVDEPGCWKHTKHLKVSAIIGTPKERLAALRVKADIYSINYEGLIWLAETLKDNWPFKTVVADELTKTKGYRTRQGSKRAKALASFAHTKVSRFIGLTGTPAANGLADLWGQIWFLDRGERLGRTFSGFEANWFTRGYDGFSLKPNKNAQTEIEAALSDICLTVKGLPVDEPIRNTIFVDLPPAARELYKDMERDAFAEIAEIGVEAANAAVKTIKLRQIACGAAYVDDQQSWELVHDEKIEALRSVVEEAAGMPVLVAYSFKSDLQRLLKAFPQARHLDADPKTIDKWNAGEIPILLAHPASASHGINLAVGGNILAFFSVGWSLEEYQQIVERLGPVRQKQAGLNRPVFLHHIVARDTIDVEIMERLASKSSVQDALLKAMQRRGLK